MFATLCLLSGVLVTAQPPAPSLVEGTDNIASPKPRALVQPNVRTARPVSGDWQIAPKLPQSLELLYKGTFTEDASGGSVEFQRAYRFETRLLVLESSPQGTEVAVLTLLKDRNASSPTPMRGEGGAGNTGRVPARAARLEILKIDAQGRVTTDRGGIATVSVDGLPTLECGMFVATSKGRVSSDRPWTVTEPGRPAQSWEVAGTGVVDGTPCVKVVGVQKSSDWDQPRGDRRSWRRQDTVWVAPRTGVAHRVERVIEQRAAVRSEPTLRSVLSYELESSIQYPVELVKERQNDIIQFRQLTEAARPHFEQPTRAAAQFAALVARADKYLQGASTSPYREAIAHLREKLDAARRGEVAASVLPESPTAPEAPKLVVPAEAKIGKPAPDFVAPDLCIAGKSCSLKNWSGRPILLVFYSPGSRTLDDMMRFIGALAAQHQQLAVVLLTMSGTPAEVTAMKTAKRWPYPILNGSGLNISYGVDATPRLVLIDASGIVRVLLTGWGPEAPGELTNELRSCLK